MYGETLEEEDDPTVGFLEPDYEPDGVVESVSTAKGLVSEANLKLPRPSSPKVNFENWRRVIDLLEVDVITELGHKINDYDLAKCFKTLSIKLDEDTPFSVEEDIINIKIGSEIDDTQSTKKRISGVTKHAIDVLPPVTSALMGGYLCEVRVFEKNNYYENILPEDKKYGGLNKPYRRSIEVTDYSSCRIHKNLEKYPCKNSSFSSSYLHELGHVIHNLYGFLRPGDAGYEYPSNKNELKSTGCISPINLTERQSEFVYDVFRTYVYNQMDCYEDIHYSRYGHTHPVEAFACAFEILCRNGGEKILEDYRHFNDVFTHLI